MASDEKVDIHWCRDPEAAPELAQFFAANITPEYISHSELQGPRALDVGVWRPDIVRIFEDEIRRRVDQYGDRTSTTVETFPILEVRANGRLVGIALISFCVEAPVPYAILEDVAVEAAKRNAGIGTAVIDWVADAATKLGCARLFLESGVGNHHAHELFERKGFSQVSIVMMKRLSEATTLS